MPRSIYADDPSVDIFSPKNLISLINDFSLSLDELLEAIYQISEDQADELGVTEMRAALSELKPIFRSWILSRTMTFL